MAGTVITQWPSQTWAWYQAEVAANQITEQAHTPTWPAHLQPPHGNASAHPQPNMCLQLTQILEWEIWNHEQTRAGMQAEQNRCEELEGHVWKLERDIAQWQQACTTVSAALNKHRMEHASLQSDLNGIAVELEQLRQIHHQPKREVSTASSVVDAL
jgi:hypothetical protein